MLYLFRVAMDWSRRLNNLRPEVGCHQLMTKANT
jgi:hypothetical protein